MSPLDFDRHSAAAYDSPTTIDVLREKAAHQGNRPAYTFLVDGETEGVDLTYGELDRRSRAIGRALQLAGATGERVLLLYPHGLEFVAAFWGCLYGGAVAVPAYPPRLNRSQLRFKQIIEDSRATLALTSKAMLGRVERVFSEAPDARRFAWLATDDLDDRMGEEWREPAINRDTLAMIQYTSGSTSAPKGVMVSHDNLMSNQRMIQQAFHQTEDSIVVGWLPLYHDMGLIGNVLQPLFLGARCVLMSPTAFLQKPSRWLQAISAYRATTSGGPNFAYDLCVRKISVEERARLDLSSWTVAFNGAEPIFQETMERFATAFAGCGFRREAFYPCYGLAEATLLVSAGASDRRSWIETGGSESAPLMSIGAHPDRQHKVSCGRLLPSERVVIVDPKSLTSCPDEEVGEIWVSGPNVARGYWNRDRETRQTFGAYLEKSGDGPFLRTGDLGYLKDGELFVTGRIKDLIIIRGRNHYPQDIELTVQQADPALASGACAAFSIEVASEERLVIAKEFSRGRLNSDTLIESIRESVSGEHEIQAHAIVLVDKGSLPKTTSGKLQRYECKNLYQSGELATIVEWHEQILPEAETAQSPDTNRLLSIDAIAAKAIETSLSSFLAAKLECGANQVDINRPLLEQGADSLTAIELSHHLEAKFGVVLPSANLLEAVTIAGLARQALEHLRDATSHSRPPITPCPKDVTEHPLSYGQRSLWFLYRLAPLSAAYNVSSAIRIRSALDAGALRRALQKIVDRHDTLRTTFRSGAGEPFQRVEENLEISLPEVDASSWSDEFLDEYMTAEAHRPFNLEQYPLLRVSVLSRSPQEHILLVVAHHIVVDLWSMGVLLHEWGLFYKAEMEGAVAPLDPLPVRYADYVHWQRRLLESSVGERLWSYWQSRLAGDSGAVNLPTDRPRPSIQTFKGDSLSICLSSHLTQALKSFGQKRRATLYQTLQAIFYVLLHRYTAQEDITVGGPTTGRNAAGLARLIGYFVNPVALRADLSGNPTFNVFLERICEVTSTAIAHQDYPLALLVERLQPERDPKLSPLFQVMFALQKAPSMGEEGAASKALFDGTPLNFGGLPASSMALRRRACYFDLCLSLGETDAGLQGGIEYNTDLFDEWRIHRMAGHFRTVIESVIADPMTKIGELVLMSAEEIEQVLVEFNQTGRECEREQCVQALFEAQVEETPQAIAVAHGDYHLSYGDLNVRANRLAHALRHLGIQPEVRAAICAERGMEMVIGLLAILKAGGAYVPLDPAYPAERLSLMLEDSAPAVLLMHSLAPREAQSAIRLALGGTGVPVIDLQADSGYWAGQPDTNPSQTDVGSQLEHLAYLIYTSGSTGRPKGVMVEHRNLANLIGWHNAAFELTGADRCSSVAGFGFDAATWEIWPPLCVGATLLLSPLRAGGDPEGLLAWWSAQELDVSFLPTPLAELGFTGGHTNRHLRTLLIGGDRLRQRPPLPLSFSLINNYGPTEATVVATSGCVDEEDPVLHIGRPVGNTKIYLLDTYGQPVPIGIAGEVCIAGAGIARGYLNHSHLTAERFGADAFGGEPGARIYRTGDLARYLPDGRIEFLGRNDFQVKLRGFRIEPGEIEARLAAHPAIRETAVTACEDSRGDKHLVAYYTSSRIAANGGAEGPVTAETLRAYLSSALPEYMVPETYVALEVLPLTPNGKLDRKALLLAAQTRGAMDPVEVVPWTPVEEILTEIFLKVLKLDRIGRDDSFFAAGGHSLLATQVVSRIRDVFGVELGVRSVFEEATVKGLARRVERAIRAGERDEAPPLVSIDREKHRSGPGVRLPLSFAQQRLWFIEQLEPGNLLYNIPGVVRLEGKLDLEVLERVINEVVRRHEALRTRFEVEGGEPVQVIDEWKPRRLEITDLSGISSKERQEEMRRIAREEAATGFDLSRGPLLRVKVLKLEEGQQVALFTMHHIVSDGWSMEILIRELGILYRAYRRGESSPLQEMAIQYADFAVWQREWLQGEVLRRELDYWRNQLAGIGVLELPTDRPRPAVPSYRGGRRAFLVERELSEKLRALGQREGVTTFMTLLGAFQILMSRYSGQEDVALGTDIANRNRAEIEGVIGFFVNQLVLRLRVRTGENFSQMLKRVREMCLGAYGRQDAPFEKLVEALHPKRDSIRTPLFQVKLIWQNTQRRVVELEETKLSIGGGELQANGGSQTAKFDLTVSIADVAADDECGLLGTAEYSRDLFDEETVGRLMSHYISVLQGIVREGGESPISGLSLLSETERKQIVVEWNETGRLYPNVRQIHELFVEQAMCRPEGVAVKFEEQQISYRELNERANRVARYLQELGVGPEVIVGICLERSIDLVIGLLGVLKAGGAYLPMDPAFPDERLEMMIDDAEIRLLLTQKHLAERCFARSADLVCLDRDWNLISLLSHEDFKSQAEPDNAIYVIYTSGSTGKPKGVVITHRSVFNLFKAVDENMCFGEEDVWTMFHSSSFDFSVWEIWGALICGGKLVLVPHLMARAPEEFCDLVYREGVTILSQTPFAFRHFIRAGEVGGAGNESNLRAVIFGGEALEVLSLKEWVDRYGDQMPRLINMYGITETTVHTTYRRVTSEDFTASSASIIGKPLTNINTFVFDEEMQPAPIGVAGELYVGGAGVARGYLQKQALTAERFVPAPDGREPGARVYQTGDMARYLKDGSLEYLGRRDHQVKIRGYRIELGEIESALLQYDAIREAVVIAREEPGMDKSLVAYLVSSHGNGIAMNELRSYLRRRLPDYMVPAAFVMMENLPQTSNGKLDRNALSGLVWRRRDGEADYAAPRTPVEEILVGLFEDVLRLDRAGIRDNFFEIGGHSLLATQLVSRARDIFGVEIGVRSIFEEPTAEGLAGRIEAMIVAREKPESPPFIRASREDRLPLSFAQQRLWFLDQLVPDSPFYNIPVEVKLEGELDLVVFESVINEIIRRHEVLRTRFVAEAGEPAQVIDDWKPRSLEVMDLTGRSPEEREEEGRRIARAEAGTGFNLSRGPLLRVRVLKLEAEQHVALFTMHHIVSDAWSMKILSREVGELYRAYRAGESSPLEELPIQYADFALWQRAHLAGSRRESEIEYWKDRLREAAVLDLPADHARPPAPSYRGGRESVKIGNSSSEELKRLADREGATMFMVLMAAFKVLLRKYSGAEDLSVGTVIANRTRREVEGLIGFFANTLVLRTDLGGDPSFSELIRRERAVALGAYAHQEAPFERLVEEINPERDLSRSPLFQVMMGMQAVSREELRIDGVMVRREQSETGMAKFDLTLMLAEEGGAISGSVEYSLDLFEQETIRRMARHYGRVVEEVVKDAKQRIGQIELMSRSEREQIVVRWNETAVEYPRNRSIPELFEEQVNQNPDRVMVIYEEQVISYRELNRRANQLARHLRRLGVGPEAPVGICIERSLEMIVGLLGILKAGGAYLPLDPAYPAERLRFMLEDAGPPVILAQERLLDVVPEFDGEILCLDRDWLQLAEEVEENLPLQTWSENPAYVIYTSGSTGHPKGVSAPHQQVVNFFTAMDAYLEPDPTAVWLAITSICFDISVLELLWTLARGFPVVVQGEPRTAPPASEPGGNWPRTTKARSREQTVTGDSAFSLPAQIAKHRVTHLQCTPAMAQILCMEAEALEDLSSLRELMVGGEKFPGGLTEYLKRSMRAGIRNLYGPTETTVWSATYEVRGDEGEIPIGRPIANTQIYLLDAALEVVPVGVHGELYIGGEGVVRGYLDRPDLTAERFLPDSFSAGSGARLYRTGDLARYRTDGNIEFLGRIDHQAKIRGFRIELGEIEVHLRSHPAVKHCAVVARQDAAAEKRLVAYVVWEAENARSVRELRRYLRERLPEYMLPERIVWLAQLPLTPNGKVDRRALPAPELNGAEEREGYLSPRTPVEEMVAEIYQEVLKLDRVGRDDNFFEIGGHSLLATQAASRVASATGVRIGVRSIFEEPTVRGVARRIAEAMRAGEKAAEPPLVSVPRDRSLPLSFAQERLWFIDQMDPGNALSNIPGAVRLKGRLNLAALEWAINEVIRRHEVLRTRIEAEAGEPVQVIDHWEPRSLEVEDLSTRSPKEREEEVGEIIRAEAGTGFDLKRGPLLRVRILKLEEEEHMALFTMHHIASDGWSIRILIAEIDRLYVAYAEGEESPLEELAIQYADFAIWQREWLRSDAIKQMSAYWTQRLAGVQSLLPFPADRQRPAVPTYRGAGERFVLSRELSDELKRHSRSEGVTPFMSLLAGFQLLLARYSGERRIAVGSPVAGRNREEIEGLIGFFVNTLVMVTDVSGNPTVKDLLQQVRETAIGAFAHQDLPFEKLVEELQPERSLNRQPFFQMMFAFQNHLQEPLAISGLQIREEQIEIENTNYDLTLTAVEEGGRITGLVEYARDLFEQESIRRFLSHFSQLLEGLVANRERRVLDIPLLTEQEWAQVSASNRTAAEYAADKRIHEIFEAQAERAPDRVAGIDDLEQVSYGELNRRANRLGNYLRRRGAGPEVRIGICLERGIDVLVGLLGILKAGGAYVPLDPAYPAERLAFLLEDAGVQLIVTQEKLRGGLDPIGAELICIDRDSREVARESGAGCDSGVDGKNLAYIIYTSGSTGRPKGAMITHRSVVNLITDAVRKFELNHNSRFLQFASLSFDVAVEEIFPAWSIGAAVVLQSNNLLYSYSDLIRAIEWHEVTTIELPTIYWVEWMREMSRRQRRAPQSLNLVIIGGERISPEILQEWREHNIHLLHVYGVTEAAVTSIVYPIPEDFIDEPSRSEIPIGRPMANIEVYLFCDRLQPMPLHLPGEMYLGGDGLARGYLNQPELTAERFVPSPFGPQPGSRLYRSGDLARYSPDGEIEFLRRLDHQIKIRGHRIEPAEIESVLLQAPQVRECIVTVSEGEPNNKQLIAYLVLKEGNTVTIQELRQFLKQRLPTHLVPSSFVILESFPLSPHGKVERQALPPPVNKYLETDSLYLAPSTPIEEDVARIFREVLRIERVGIYDDFFALGGHSLLMIQIISRVNRAFQINLPIRALFDAPTVNDLVAIIVESQAKGFEDDVLSQMLAELERLSDDEVDAAFNNGASGR